MRVVGAVAIAWMQRPLYATVVQLAVHPAAQITRRRPTSPSSCLRPAARPLSTVAVTRGECVQATGDKVPRAHAAAAMLAAHLAPHSTEHDSPALIEVKPAVLRGYGVRLIQVPFVLR